MKKWKGTFNWYNEVITLHTNAESEIHARHRFICVLAKILKREVWAVQRYFNGEKDNYNIKEVQI